MVSKNSFKKLVNAIMPKKMFLCWFLSITVSIKIIKNLGYKKGYSLGVLPIR